MENTTPKHIVSSSRTPIPPLPNRAMVRLTTTIINPNPANTVRRSRRSDRRPTGNWNIRPDQTVRLMNRDTWETSNPMSNPKMGPMA